MLKFLKITSLIFPIAGALASCGNPKGQSDTPSSDPGNRSIAAYPGEVPFDKQYNVTITLPMKEVDFVKKLDDLSLKYSIVGDPKKGLVNPDPRMSKTISENDISRVYQIYGGIDKKKSIGRIYRAFVNKNNEIIFIENAFEYPGT